MPALPWTKINPEPPATGVFVTASRPEAASLRHVPRFVRLPLAARRQIRRAPSGSRSPSNPPAASSGPLRPGRARGALRAYAGAEPHDSTMKRLRPTMRRSRSVFRALPGERPLASWGGARTRLGEARARQP